MLENGRWGEDEFHGFSPTSAIALPHAATGTIVLGVFDFLEFNHYSRRDARPCVSTITRVYGHIVCSYNYRRACFNNYPGASVQISPYAFPK